MTANPLHTRIWRSQYLQSIELVHGVSKCYSLPRHFHEEVELNIKQGDGWQYLVKLGAEIQPVDRVRTYINMTSKTKSRRTIGKLLICLVAVFTAVAPYLADWNVTHIYMDIVVIFPLITLGYYLENRALKKADS